MREKFLSRRYFLVCSCAVIFTVLLYLSKLDAGTYERLIIAIVGGFLTSSYFEKRLEKNA